MGTIVFIDGQNLFHLARLAWSGSDSDASARYAWPSYDIEKLANAVALRVPRRSLSGIRFYTGVPDPALGARQKFWHGFWSNKTRPLKNKGIYVYRGRVGLGGQEKGVDVSLAIDLVKATYEKSYEVVVIMSQDWDFGPAVHLAKSIAREQGRQLVFESAFPYGPGSVSKRGVPGTEWTHIDQETYDRCFDPVDYRPRRPER